MCLGVPLNLLSLSLSLLPKQSTDCPRNPRRRRGFTKAVHRLPTQLLRKAGYVDGLSLFPFLLFFSPFCCAFVVTVADLTQL